MPYMRLLFSFKIIPFFIFMFSVGCAQRNYNVDMKPKPETKPAEVKSAIPTTATKPDTLVKATPQDSVNQANAAALAGAKATVKEEPKKKKKKKNVFLGY